MYAFVKTDPTIQLITYVHFTVCKLFQFKNISKKVSIFLPSNNKIENKLLAITKIIK